MYIYISFESSHNLWALEFIEGEKCSADKGGLRSSTPFHLWVSPKGVKLGRGLPRGTLGGPKAVNKGGLKGPVAGKGV